jgi:hypothetical protein
LEGCIVCCCLGVDLAGRSSVELLFCNSAISYSGLRGDGIWCCASKASGVVVEVLDLGSAADRTVEFPESGFEMLLWSRIGRLM